jgi:hypothetical protein
MDLANLQRRLIELARRRVRSGAATERGLARQSGISQPHLHNSLKGVRVLSSAACGRLMQALGVTAADLLWPSAGAQDMGIRGVPLMRHRIGPGIDAQLGVHSGFLPLPAALTDKLIEPLAARLAPDLALPPELAPNDTVLLDRNPALRADPPPHGIWVVEAEGGLRVRYLRMEGGSLQVGIFMQGRPREWQRVALAPRRILDIVKARVVWMSRALSAGGSAGPHQP